MSTERYSKELGAIVNAYVDQLVARVSGRGDPEAHAAAAEAFDAALERMERAADTLDYLADWVDSDGLVIRCSRIPEAWTRAVNELPTLEVRRGDDDFQTLQDAIREDMAKNATRHA